jgi:NTP pyrophosphatase (non-canonical NTP hydrolase)
MLRRGISGRAPKRRSGARRNAGALLAVTCAKLRNQSHVTSSAQPLLPNSYDGIRTLQEEFDRYQRQAFPERPSSFFSLELCGEAGELANLEKKVWKGRTIADADFVDEAADVLIALLNYCNSRGIDLAAAAEKKMAEIERRRRGGTP